MNYANQREWLIRVLAAPRIPRGNQGYVESLRIILNHVNNEVHKEELITIPGSNSINNLDSLCVRLRPLGIVKQKSINGNWILSEESEKWLNNHDDLFVASMINGNMKFFAEFIDFCRVEKDIQEIKDYAREKYDIDWQGKSQLLDRAQWLKDLGFLKFLDFKNKYISTEKGIEFINIVTPHKIIEQQIVNIEAKEIKKIDKEVYKIIPTTQEQLQERKVSVGYIPGSSNQSANIIFESLDFINQAKDLKVINKYYGESYGIKVTSTRSFLHHLTNLGLIEKVSLHEYELTVNGQILRRDKNIMDLLAIYHSKFKFIMELLNELLLDKKSRKELYELANTSYGITANIRPNVSHRLNLLEQTGLIYLYKNKFEVNENVELLLKDFVLEKSAVLTTVETEEGTKENIHSELIYELKESSRDSMNPTRFEQAIKVLFSRMGFEAESIGGSGNTDVLLKSPGALQHSYTVCVDAKSAYSGPVTDGHVDFDTLKEHKNKHKADYVVIIGNNFNASSRLVRRAKEHSIGLIDVNSFIELYTNHLNVPLSFDKYIKIFNQSGIINIDLLQNDSEQMIRTAKLMRVIVESLSENSTEILTPRDLYWIINSKKIDGNKYTEEEIKSMLQFLSSPLISSIGYRKEGYYAVGSKQDVKQKFQFYMNQI